MKTEKNIRNTIMIIKTKTAIETCKDKDRHLISNLRHAGWQKMWMAASHTNRHTYKG